MAESSKKERLKAKKEEKIMIRRRRNVLIVMIELVLCLVLAITCYGVTVLNSYRYDELSEDVYMETTNKTGYKETRMVTSVVEYTNEVGETETSIVEVPIETELSGYRNILILGIDTRDMDFEMTDGINSDVIMIVSINNETGDVRLVSILRDTVMKFESGSRKPYNKATEQFYGGVSDMVSMLNRNLGLAIDEYVLVNWYSVAVCINQMGGVTLNIPDQTFLTYFNSYLDFTNRATGIWAPELYAPGTYLMTGTQAVAYCRIRSMGINDQGRAENQRQVIGQLVENAKAYAKQGDINTLLATGKTALQNVRTNL
ncbi:MAG: LCP family protein, partial [Lachnospiraceae bacterium]|nr:LCP family protein [Lachnospiraceae bacterium]